LPCTNGLAIPGIDELSSLQNVQIKIRETLTTSDGYVSPELQEVNIEIITAWGNVAYGPNKSTLTAWDSISLAWKPERLSLVVNDEEACYIENPGLPTALGSHVFIGTDRNGANAINTLVDELRIDKVYRDADTRVSWHKVKSPFYSSEEIQTVAAAQANLARIKAEAYADGIVTEEEQARIAQAEAILAKAKAYADGIVTEEEQARIAQAEAILAVANSKFNAPGYVISTNEGIKVYDPLNNLRVLIGSWVEDAIRKYGIRIIDGLIEASKIYGTSFQSGGKGATSYVRIGAGYEPLEIYENGKKALNIWSFNGGMIQFYNTVLDSMLGQITTFNDVLGQGIRVHGRNAQGQDRDVSLLGRDVHINSKQIIDLKTNTDGWISIDAGGGIITANGSLTVFGSISKTGTLHYVEPTQNYGTRLLNAVEAPELKYYDSGVTYLENGEAIVLFDPIFLECIEPDTELTPWQIWVQCYGENDVYVAEVGTDYFVIKERNGGTSNNKVIWRFEATRKNYAGIRLMEVV